MFMVEILGRCSTLEQRVANVYTQLADNLPREETGLKGFWLKLAEEERQHGQILAAEKKSLEADADPGYFMPEFSARLMAIDAMLQQAEEKARAGVSTAEAFHLALDLEQSELNAIYRDIVLTGRATSTLLATQLNQSLRLPRHQQHFVDGVKQFVPGSPIQQRAEKWLTQNRLSAR